MGICSCKWLGFSLITLLLQQGFHFDPHKDNEPKHLCHFPWTWVDPGLILYSLLPSNWFSKQLISNRSNYFDKNQWPRQKWHTTKPLDGVARKTQVPIIAYCILSSSSSVINSINIHLILQSAKQAIKRRWISQGHLSRRAWPPHTCITSGSLKTLKFTHQMPAFDYLRFNFNDSHCTLFSGEKNITWNKYCYNWLLS